MLKMVEAAEKFIQFAMRGARKMQVDQKKEDSLDKIIEVNIQESDQILQWIIWSIAMKFMEKINLMMIQMLRMKSMFNFQIKEKEKIQVK